MIKKKAETNLNKCEVRYEIEAIKKSPNQAAEEQENKKMGKKKRDAAEMDMGVGL